MNDFKEFRKTITGLSRRTQIATLCAIRKYLRNHRPTVDEFMRWASTASLNEAVFVRKYMIFLGFPRSDLLRLKKNQKVDESVLQKLEELGEVFTWRQAQKATGLSEGKLREILKNRAYKKEAISYRKKSNGKVGVFMWAYSLQPFEADELPVELDDPFKPEEIEIQVQLLGEECERYEEMVRKRSFGLFWTYRGYKKKKPPKEENDGRRYRTKEREKR